MSQRLSLVGGLFLVLFVVLIAMPPASERQVPLTVYSAEPSGGKALRLWLEALGYRVTTLEGDRYAIGQDVGVVLLLAPSQPIGTAALRELERWNRAGGRLIVAASGLPTRELLSRFDISARMIDGVDRAVPAESGLLDPAIETVSVEEPYELILGDRSTGATPLLLGQRSGDVGPDGVTASGGHPPILAARVPVDKGDVIVLGAPSVLSNAGLRDEAHARLALSLIGPAGRGQLAFDELHHGFGALQRRSIYSLLLEQAWGRAALLAGGVVTLFLLARGRRLGRAVPVFVDRGRSLGELVTSQAGLYRAGGKRAFVAEHLARQLRHDLAVAVGLLANASDDEIATRATAMGRDPTRALRVLAETQRARSDRALLSLTREGERARAELSQNGVPSPPAPLPTVGEGRTVCSLPSPTVGRGAGGEGTPVGTRSSRLRCTDDR